VLPFAIGSVLANVGIPISVELLVNSMPSKDTIQNLVTTNEIDACILTQEIIRKDTNVYISFDVDCTDEDTANISAAIVHSLSRLFGDVPIILHEQCTDSGGGGTKHAFARAMQANGMTHVHYLVATCSLHNLQTGLRNGVQHVLGEGGMDDNGGYLMNAMQML